MNPETTKKDLQLFLQRELVKYLTKIGPLSGDELVQLREWVASGNSAYDNPALLYNESGAPMCFIEALRVDALIREDPSSFIFGSLCTDDAYSNNSIF